MNYIASLKSAALSSDASACKASEQENLKAFPQLERREEW